ncbi:cupredoxin [Artemisia annua]|uniref:Cupredoxin n=1 Tax=Artemisia annua TaxID=35608 RepID=A0A2U1MSP9_ARTAN|nr:cupredoxin [Artemisia annua]
MKKMMFAVFIAVITMAFTTAMAAKGGEVYIVGDGNGWTNLGHIDYKTWAATKHFQVGDSIGKNLRYNIILLLTCYIIQIGFIGPRQSSNMGLWVLVPGLYMFKFKKSTLSEDSGVQLVPKTREFGKKPRFKPG